MTDVVDVIPSLAVTVSIVVPLLVLVLKDRMSLGKRIDGMDKDIGELKLKVSLFWDVVAKEVPKLLHSPHTPEMDSLLEKLQADTLKLDETLRLKALLQNDVEQEKTDLALAKVLFLAVVEERIKKLEAKR